MGRWLGLFVVFVMGFLYCFASGNSMFWGLSRGIDCVEVLSDLDNEKLLKINGCLVDDFVEFLDLQNYSKFTIEDRVVIEGYSNKLNNYIVINNKKINVQISVSQDCCLVGYPLIKNSFWLLCIKFELSVYTLKNLRR